MIILNVFEKSFCILHHHLEREFSDNFYLLKPILVCSFQLSSRLQSSQKRTKNAIKKLDNKINIITSRRKKQVQDGNQHEQGLEYQQLVTQFSFVCRTQDSQGKIEQIHVGRYGTQSICFWVIFCQSMSWAGHYSKQLRRRIEEVYQLWNHKPMTYDWYLTQIQRQVPQIAATAKIMPAKQQKVSPIKIFEGQAFSFIKAMAVPKKQINSKELYVYFQACPCSKISVAKQSNIPAAATILCPTSSPLIPAQILIVLVLYIPRSVIYTWNKMPSSIVFPKIRVKGQMTLT